MTILRTTRSPGKIDPAEVRRFQEHYGIQVDGMFGSQSLGQALEIEAAYEALQEKCWGLEDRPEPQCTLWGALLTALGMAAAWAFGLFDWLSSLL